MWPFSSATTSVDNASVRSSPSPAATPTPPADHPPMPPTSASGSADKCPVDHSTRAAWLQAQQNAASPFHPSTPTSSAAAAGGSSSTSSNSAAGDAASSSSSSKITPGMRVSAGQRFARLAETTTQDSSSKASSSAASPAAGPPSRSTGAPAVSWQSEDAAGSSGSTSEGVQMPRLSTQRVVSSIPRFESENDEAAAAKGPGGMERDPSGSGNWVYPSEQQFFLAMLRKNHKPRAEDMATIVPIHNLVNEKAWQEVLKWEKGQGGEKCGGVRLVSFKGRPKDRTPKAWINTALGYTPPFDRHDWIINRCGKEVRYVIDFYTGKGSGASSLPPKMGPDGLPMPPKDAAGLSFYLDVRPAVDDWTSLSTRAAKWFGL